MEKMAIVQNDTLPEFQKFLPEKSWQPPGMFLSMLFGSAGLLNIQEGVNGGQA